MEIKLDELEAKVERLTRENNSMTYQLRELEAPAKASEGASAKIQLESAYVELGDMKQQMAMAQTNQQTLQVEFEAQAQEIMKLRQQLEAANAKAGDAKQLQSENKKLGAKVDIPKSFISEIASCFFLFKGRHPQGRNR